MSNPEMVPVRSSNIDAVGYDAGASVLHVRFKSGKTHQYHDVPADAHSHLISASSIGSHFHHHIREKYRSTVV